MANLTQLELPDGVTYNLQDTISGYVATNATTTKDGLMSYSDKSKLNGVASNAEVNQNAFSIVSVKGSTISATAKTDTLSLSPGTNIVLITDAANKSLTISAPNLAELDSSGKIIASQLPSFVDDVLEYSSKSSFPSTGESGKIYVDLSTNITYRWSGTAYVEISPTLALGETSSTAYRGDRGSTAYSHATDSSKLSTATESGLYKVASTAQGHIASLTAVVKKDITDLGIPGSNTDTKVTSAANHYAPSTASGSDVTASASGASASWSIDVVKGITLNTDGKGHVTGMSVTSGKIPGNPNTDRYVNSASFADDTTASASSPVKMTLTRAGSDTATVTANIPKVSASSAGVAPKGASVSSQSQSTKFLREDGTWSAPSYTVNTDTKVTSVGNHYSPTADSSAQLSASASGATAAWSIDVVKGVQLQRDAKGHVTGVTVTSGKIPANPNTDTKVTSVSNHYAPAEDTSAVLSADASSTTAATWNSTSLVTGVDIKRDAKGHVVGISVDSIKMPANPNTNTTYTFANGTNGFTVTPSGGTAQTVTVTPSIANNITGSGTSGYIAKFNGTNTITNGPAFGSGTTTYLRNDGSWATPPDNDTKNTAGSTDTSSKIFLIGATSQAANPQTYSDNEVYVTSGVLQTKNTQATAVVAANTSNSGTAGGLSLYGTSPTDYGIAFRSTGNGGKHGYVQGDWAQYHYMAGADTRGWVFNAGASTGVASISRAGHMVLNGSLTVGGNSTNTSGVRQVYNATTQSLDFVFVA